MTKVCPECGAPVPAGGSCRDHFHALLLLEAEFAGAAGPIAHFHAVAAYLLQHPESMNVHAEALSGLRTAVADALEGRATVAELRRRAQEGARGPGRVTRREGDAPIPWPRGPWPMTVADVCTAETFGEIDNLEAYLERVMAWARSVLETLNTLAPRPMAGKKTDFQPDRRFIL